MQNCEVGKVSKELEMSRSLGVFEREVYIMLKQGTESYGELAQKKRRGLDQIIHLLSKC